MLVEKRTEILFLFEFYKKLNKINLVKINEIKNVISFDILLISVYANTH